MSLKVLLVVHDKRWKYELLPIHLVNFKMSKVKQIIFLY